MPGGGYEDSSVSWLRHLEDVQVEHPPPGYRSKNLEDYRGVVPEEPSILALLLASLFGEDAKESLHEVHGDKFGYPPLPMIPPWFGKDEGAWQEYLRQLGEDR